VSSAAGKKRRGGDFCEVLLHAASHQRRGAHAPPATPIPHPTTKKEVESLCEVIMQGDKSARVEAEASKVRYRVDAAIAAVSTA